jgi:hypothetical protein
MEDEIGVPCSTQGKMNENNILVGKLEGMRSLGRGRHGWEDNIKMDLRRYVGIVWTGFIWALVNTVMNRRVP